MLIHFCNFSWIYELTINISVCLLLLLFYFFSFNSLLCYKFLDIYLLDLQPAYGYRSYKHLSSLHNTEINDVANNTSWSNKLNIHEIKDDRATKHIMLTMKTHRQFRRAHSLTIFTWLLVYLNICWPPPPISQVRRKKLSDGRCLLFQFVGRCPFGFQVSTKRVHFQ